MPNSRHACRDANLEGGGPAAAPGPGQTVFFSRCKGVVPSQPVPACSQVSVSETLIWRAVDLLLRLDLGRLSGRDDGAGAQTSSSDVPIQASRRVAASPSCTKHLTQTWHRSALTLLSLGVGLSLLVHVEWCCCHVLSINTLALPQTTGEAGEPGGRAGQGQLPRRHGQPPQVGGEAAVLGPRPRRLPGRPHPAAGLRSARRHDAVVPLHGVRIV